ncbi:TetR/AcrR family transcriptional regulator [Stackebrandtia soli]|uniref:TetR/AcrR family transcriptional regulator n=1 Tax=Stackebrandtia soli TaxID=1892856 RepID=UPI0039E89C86
MDDVAGLPPEVRAAWGLTSGSRRGVRPELSLERIITAAIVLADGDGLSAASMARVAKQLGFSTMALYRHVGSKEELLAHMQDHALGSPPRDLSDGLDWRDGLTVWARQALAQYLAHPWMLDVPISGPPLMPRNLEWTDWAMGILAGQRLAPFEKLSTLMLILGLVRNEAEMVVDIWEDGEPEPDEEIVYESRLRTVVDADRLPALHALLEEGLFTGATEAAADNVSLDFGLHRILDGIHSLMEERT